MTRSAFAAACATAVLIACTSGASDNPAPTPITHITPTQASIDLPPSPTPTAKLVSGLDEALVVRAIDGDTVVLEGGERLRRVAARLTRRVRSRLPRRLYPAAAARPPMCRCLVQEHPCAAA